MTDVATLSPPPNASEVPLILREALFGNPTRAGGMISHDGNWLGWMAPHEGVMNVDRAHERSSRRG